MAFLSPFFVMKNVIRFILIRFFFSSPQRDKNYEINVISSSYENKTLDRLFSSPSIQSITTKQSNTNQNNKIRKKSIMIINIVNHQMR